MAESSRAAAVMRYAQMAHLALADLYGNTSPQAKSEAEDVLKKIRGSPIAWPVSWSLLEAQNATAESAFYAANTLQHLLPSTLQSMPAQQQDTVRARLLSALKRFATGPPVVLRQLCLALAHLTYLSDASIWAGQPASVSILVAAASMSTPQLHHRVLAQLHFATAMPQVACTVETVDQGVGMRLVSEMEACRFAALPLIMSTLACDASDVDGLVAVASDHEAAERSHAGLACLGTWLECDPHLALEDFAPAIGMACVHLHVDSFFDAALECLLAFVTRQDLSSQPSMLEMGVDIFRRTEQMMHHASRTGDHDRLEGLCRLLVSLLEVHMKTLLEREQSMLALLDLLLRSCTNVAGKYPVDEEISANTLALWYQLVEHLTTLERESRYHAREVYTPLLLSLVRVLLDKATIPDEDAVWDEEATSDFWAFRDKAGDVIMFFSLFNKDVVLQAVNELCDSVRHYLSRQKGVYDNTEHTDISKWQHIEVSLFCVARAAPFFPRTEQSRPTVERIVSTVSEAAQVHPLVSRAAIRAVGALAPWFSVHPTMLSMVLPVVLEAAESCGGIADSSQKAPGAPSVADDTVQHAQAGCLALRDLCDDCGKHLLDFIPRLMRCWQVNIAAHAKLAASAGVGSRQAAGNSTEPGRSSDAKATKAPAVQGQEQQQQVRLNIVTADDTLRNAELLGEAMAMVVKHVDSARLTDTAMSVLAHCHERLRALLQEYGQSSKAKPETLACLCSSASYLRHVEGENAEGNPVSAVCLAAMSPLLKDELVCWACHEDVESAVSDCIVKSLRCSRAKGVIAVPQLLEALTQAVSTMEGFTPSLLLACAAVASTQSSDQSLHDAWMNLFDAVHTRIAGLFQSQRHIDFPDVIASYFQLLQHLWQYLYTRLASSAERLCQLLACITAGLTMAEPPCNQAAANALIYGLKALTPRIRAPEVETAMATGATALVGALLRGISHESARAVVPDMSAALWAMRQATPSLLARVAASLLSDPAFLPPSVTEASRKHVLDTIRAQKITKDKFMSALSVIEVSS